VIAGGYIGRSHLNGTVGNVEALGESGVGPRNTVDTQNDMTNGVGDLRGRAGRVPGDGVVLACKPDGFGIGRSDLGSIDVHRACKDGGAEGEEGNSNSGEGLHHEENARERGWLARRKLVEVCKKAGGRRGSRRREGRMDGEGRAVRKRLELNLWYLYGMAPYRKTGTAT